MLSVHALFYNLTNQIIFIGACYLNLYKISCHQLSAGLNEYQTIYNGTVMTFSIAQKNTFEGEEEVLNEFMDTVRFDDSGSTGLASSRPLDARTRLLIGAGVGAVAVLLLLVGVLSLIRRKTDRR